jgi:plastocyanin
LGTLEMVHFDLSRDGGSTFPIGIFNHNSTGSVQLAVPNTTWDGAAARIRASWVKDVTVKDTSNANFVILTPTVTVNSPNGGETWTSGSTQTITWSSNLPASGFMKLELSRDGGSTFPILLVASAPNSGSASVTVQSAWATTAARVRITSLTYASAVDISDANFTITSGPFITVTSPNGGETWADGSSQTITWSSNIPSGEMVKVDLSQDGGATFPIVLSSSTPNSGSLSVTVSHSWDTTTARVRVTRISDSTITDTSDANFTIGAAPPSVSIVDFAFTPGTLTIPVGTTVTWTNKGAVNHTTTSDTGLWDSGLLAPGATFSFTFSSAGTFPYHCNVHFMMTGTIVVH